jgi:SPP1 gp7 family putative phage head morphogenesis protein
MPYADAVLSRATSDADRILKAASKSYDRVAGRMRARMLEEFTSGQRLDLADYLRQYLLPIITKTMIVAHLAGYRRTMLTVQQVPHITRKVLSLAAIDDALKVLRDRASLDVNELEKKYNTNALKVVQGVSDATEAELRNEIARLVEKGAHVREAVRDLGAKFAALGMSPTKPHALEAIFRTQTQLAFAAGKWQAEQSPEVQDILWGYKYVTVGDSRVRDEHAVLEGVTLPKSDPFWQRFSPPNGWNCRCYAIPIFQERAIVAAPATDGNGNPVAPDKGFDFNPGEVFQPAVKATDKLPDAKPEQAKTTAQDVTDGAPATEDDTAAKEAEAERVRLRDIEYEKLRVKVAGIDKAIRAKAEKAAEKLSTSHAAYVKAYKDYEAVIERLQATGLDVFKRINHPDYLAAYAACKEFEGKFTKAQEAYDAANGIIANLRRDAMVNILKVEDPLKFRAKQISKDAKESRNDLFSEDPSMQIRELDKVTLKSCDEVCKMLSKIIARDPEVSNEKINAFEKDGFAIRFATHQTTDTGRAYAACKTQGMASNGYFAKTAHICVMKNEPTDVIAHEIGHFIETSFRTSGRDSLGFVDRRVGDEKAISLKAEFGGGYGDNEFGKKDDWEKVVEAVFKYGNANSASTAYYIGKPYSTYETPKEFTSTEVVSMGVQMLWRDATAFAETDPDYFKFILGVLRNGK